MLSIKKIIVRSARRSENDKKGKEIFIFWILNKIKTNLNIKLIAKINDFTALETDKHTLSNMQT